MDDKGTSLGDKFSTFSSYLQVADMLQFNSWTVSKRFASQMSNREMVAKREVTFADDVTAVVDVV